MARMFRIGRVPEFEGLFQCGEAEQEFDQKICSGGWGAVSVVFGLRFQLLFENPSRGEMFNCAPSWVAFFRLGWIICRV